MLISMHAYVARFSEFFLFYLVFMLMSLVHENYSQSLVFTGDISKITKDKFSSEVYKDQAKRIFF